MKFKIEYKDIKEVKSIAKDYYGVLMSEEKARELIERNTDLATELSHGGLDTCGRGVLSDAIVKDVLKYVPCKIEDRLNGKHWAWPLYGSSQEYKDAFDREFKRNALNRGYKLAKCWEKK